MGLFDGILEGLGWIWDQTGGRAANAAWDQAVNGLVGWVIDSISWFVTALLQFFERSSTPALGSSWFSGGPIGDTAHSPYAVVASMALRILLLFVLLSVIHGLLTGEGAAMIGRLARDVPLAVLGIVTTIGVVQVLLAAADELAQQILKGTQAGDHATAVLHTLGRVQAFSGQPTFVAFLLGLVAVVGAFLLWVELLVRASLLYILLALSPLAYAAFVWPSARRIVHRLAELVIALVLSKVVIAITLAIAASALANPSADGLATGEAKVGTLLVGAIMFALAVFTPFVVLRLLPVVEAAVVAHGISRTPARATQRAMVTALTVSRLAGTSAAGSSRPGANAVNAPPTRPPGSHAALKATNQRPGTGTPVRPPAVRTQRDRAASTDATSEVPSDPDALRGPSDPDDA